MDRVGANDVMYFATERRLASNFAAVLLLDGRVDVAEARRILGERVVGIGRLRQRVRWMPFGCGRPLWVDDASFDIARHIVGVTCPRPGDEAALWNLAASLAGEHLPRDRPLWRAVIVDGLDSGATAVVLVLHHALADGIGGLAVLAGLVDDGIRDEPPPHFPRPVPSAAAACIEAWVDRWRSLRAAPAVLTAWVRTLLTLRRLGTPSAQKTSLNTPTGLRRRVHVVRVPLAPISSLARARTATVNDVALTAVTGALHQALRRRGEFLDHLVVSLPATARADTTASRLGNDVGVMPVDLPAAVKDQQQRLSLIAEITRRTKEAGRGMPPGLVDGFSRLVAAVRLDQTVVNRQRLVNTFVSNVRGPAQPLSLFGCQIREVVPMVQTMGNVTVSFVVFSYAGTLSITVVADPDRCPDDGVVAALLAEELNALLTVAPSRAVAGV